jgi:hypothetical protein
MDDSESSVGTSMSQSSFTKSTSGLLSFMNRPSPTRHSTVAEKGAIRPSIPSGRLNPNRSDIKRIMATAKAIADDDSHPNQDEVLRCLLLPD